ncbi:MAG: hypothetical protein ABIP37_02320 [Methylotenera sp.]
MKYFNIFIGTWCMSLILPSSATAFTDGGFSRTCIARNWITGVEEPVYEQNTGDVLGGFHAYASSQPNGSWLIQYNVPKMSAESFTVRKFIFYHECAHAVYSTNVESIADCRGLQMMKSDIGVTNAELFELAQRYKSFNRALPPLGCHL